MVGVIAAGARAIGGEINAALYVSTAACCLRATSAACLLTPFSARKLEDTVANAALYVTSAEEGNVSTTRTSATSKHSWYVRFGPARCYILTHAAHILAM